MRYPVYLQSVHSGRTMAHVLDLPGCMAQGGTPEEALKRVPAAIAEVLDWLRRYGEAAPPEDEPIAVEVAEHNVSTVREEGTIGFFDVERLPVTDEDIATFLRLINYSRRELLSLAEDLPTEALTWQPDEKSWSIERILRHVASAEHWYLTRLFGTGVLPRLKPTRTVWDRLQAVRALAVERLSNLSDEDRRKVVVRNSERWSARKVMRRFLEHEREHMGHIREVLEKNRRR
ncbi:MAG: DinB family protein, partial [Anaerolineae bacterium]